MTEPRTLLSGLAIGESPRWHEGRLWVANWGTGEIVAVDLDGTSTVVARVPTVIPYCFDWLPDGRLLVVSGREAVVLRQEADGTFETHADLSGLAPVCNEIVVDGRGNAYINGGDFGPPGMIAQVTPDGSVSQVADGINFGNGMAITPDNATLIVAESYGKRLTAFDIADDGTLANRRVWADLGGDFPDGICLDAEGAVWYADVPNSHCVRVREGGEILDTVTVDRGCFACMLGGPDGTTLFIVAAVWKGMENIDFSERTGQVLAATAPAPGAGWPGPAHIRELR
jgi:sugar lactone lactonase YvrE